METVWQDLRYGVRTLWKSPGFTLVSIVVLALGIGANTTIFSVVNALLLRPPAGVRSPARMVLLGRTMDGQDFDTFTYPDYVDYRDQSTVFAGVSAFFDTPLHLSTGSDALRVPGTLVSGNYFEVLGADAARGRTLRPEDDREPGAHPVAVISDGLWRRRFGADPNVVGQNVSLNGQPFTVVGIARPAFVGTETDHASDVWLPLAMYRQAIPDHFADTNPLTERQATWLSAFARLKDNVRPAQAQAELDTIAHRLADAYPESNEHKGATISPGLGFDPNQRRDVQQLTTMLMAVVGLVLLIACANVANLLLARGVTRHKELGIRLALGAGRGRLVRQLLTESLLLAVLSGAAGLFVALWTSDLLASFIPAEALGGGTATIDLHPDRNVLLFAIGVSLLTGLIFGLIPALQTSRPDVMTVLKQTGTPSSVRVRSRLRGALVVTQIALSLVLLVCAGLFVRTLRNARAISPGFNTSHVLVAALDLGRQSYKQPQAELFYAQLTERVRALPGVEAASLAEMLPLGGGSLGTVIQLEGQPADAPGVNVDFNNVAPDYLRTMEIPLKLGRDFSARDTAAAPGVVIVNETLARKLWPNESPIGKRFIMPKGMTERATVEVVGVAADTKYRTLFERPRLYMYVPYAQNFSAAMRLHVRASGDPETLRAAVAHEVQTLDRNLPLSGVKTLREQLNSSLTQQRVAATLVAVFGLLALALAAVGLYGLLAYTVSQRTHEIGVRLALGAQTGDVLRLVLRDGLRLALLGIAVGLLIAAGVTRLLASLLYGVSALDPLTYGGVALALIVVALIASYVPARRATKVDPMVALRYE
jgi:predicted permease